MPRPLYRFKELILFLIVIAFALFVIASYYTFQKCVHNHKNDKEYEYLKDGVASVGEAITRRIVRLRLGFSCAVDEKNSGTLVAIFTGLLAFYTILCKIEYLDIFDKSHTTAACWTYNGREEVFAKHGGKKYNYWT